MTDLELDEVDARRVGLAVQRQLGDPLVLAAFAAVLAMEALQEVAAAQHGDILVERFVVAWFGNQEEREACRAQLLDERLFGVKTVGNDNCRHARIIIAEPLQHPVAGRYFAILFVVLAAPTVTVADELGSEGEHLAFVGMDDGGLQDVMVIAGDAGFGGGQAVLTVDLLGAEEA